MKKTLKYVIFCLIGIVLFYSFQRISIQSESANIALNTVLSYKQEKLNFSLLVSPVGRPVRLKIPSINIDAPIEYVGLTPDGAMGVPKGPSDAAWYELGPRPGEKGSAVIAGHSGWKNNIPAVFDNLYKLKKGDKIYVEDERGAVIVFVVRESKKYDPKANASDVFESTDGKAHLNLITCAGFWNKIWKSHSDRLVVFADKE